MSEIDARANFDARVVEVDGRAVISVRGEVDLVSADALRACIEQGADTGRALVLDLADVTFMDSTGIKALVWARRRQGRRRETVVVRNPSPAVQQVLDLAGLTGLFVVESAPDGDRG